MQRSLVAACIVGIARGALVDWDTDISGVYVRSDGSVVLTRFQGELSVSTACQISPAGEVNTSSPQTRSFGDWQDGRVRWALADTTSRTTSVWTAALPAPPVHACNVTRDQLPYEIVAMHAAGGGGRFLLLSRAGGLYSWASGERPAELPTDREIGALPGTPLVAGRNREAGASTLVILHGEEEEQRVTQVTVEGSGPATVRESSFGGCDGHRVRGIYAGDGDHDFYAWALPGRMGGASAYSLNRLSDGTLRCAEVITTGGQGDFVGGAYDGAGSLAMMAQDALYIVGGVNADPDDLHLGVPGGYAPGEFSTIMYLNRRDLADASRSVLV